MGRYLLDSNAFIWAKSSPHTLRKEARQAIEDPENTLFVSVVGLWELADKASKGKLPGFAAIMDQRPDALERALQDSNFQTMHIDLAHIARAYRLPLHHRDPFDRLMIAQALVENVTFISRDGIFHRYAGLKLLAA